LLADHLKDSPQIIYSANLKNQVLALIPYQWILKSLQNIYKSLALCLNKKEQILV
jgi:hypothetical protein|tara:strand:+ start:156 stop:320 length:165 start_codon:yes stop_codon:yes gene_type:complete